MSNSHHVKADFSQDLMNIVMDAINTAESHMPFLIDLSVEERKGMAKFGDKSRGFIEKALILAEQHPEILPQGFGIEEMRADVALLNQLHDIQLRINNLHGKIEDTLYAVGSESYSYALHIYS